MSYRLEPVRFLFEVEVPDVRLDELPGYLEQFLAVRLNLPPMLIQHGFHLGYRILTFTLSYSVGWSLYIVIYVGKPVILDIYPYGDAPEEAVEMVKEAVAYAVRSFEDHIRRFSIFFTFVEGAGVYPDKYASRKGKLIERLFADNMILFFMLFLAFNILLFAIFQFYAPFILVALQFLILLNADRIVLGMADWSLNDERRSVYVVQYTPTHQEYEWFVANFNLDHLMKIKEHIFHETFEAGIPISPQAVSKTLSYYGFPASPDKITVKSFDVYGIIEEVRRIYRLPRIKAALVNTLLANAAATGAIPWKSAVMVTTGLLAKLNEDEVRAVVGHELSHVRNMDPLILFIASIVEYLLRIYVLYPIAVLLPFLYFPLAFFLIFFIGKFLEARADLESALKLGDPRSLAEALRKIGYTRLIHERFYKAESWINFDPHPPVSFRIRRLEKLTGKERVKHLTLKSIRDVVKGFFSSF